MVTAVKNKKKVVTTKGKKKKAVARVRIKEGKGIIKINGKSPEAIEEKYSKEVLLEPLKIAEEVLGKNFYEKIDIYLNIQGGGIMGQAHAGRTALGKALVEWTKNDKLKEEFLNYDRSLLIDDVRQKEPKKYLRKGARAKHIKSYR
jgi:small subunit ribosomal protein S9